MTWIKKISTLATIASLTSGCAMYTLEELRHTTPSGTPFQKELARLYMDFASEDEKGYDWFNSWYFADKGLRAAYGKDVAPEELKNWNIPAEALPSLQRAHGELMVALTPQNEEMHPTAMAQAQFYFDCWVQRQEESWQTDRIEFCRDGFLSALDGLGAPVTKPAPEAKGSKHKAEAKETTAPEPKAEAAESTGSKEEKADAGETMSYVVFFAGDRPVITDPGQQVLDDVIKSLKDAKDYEIVLKSGAGSDPHSTLFEDRAEAVDMQLVGGGIKPDAIVVGDGKGIAARRVEIFLSQ